MQRQRKDKSEYGSSKPVPSVLLSCPQFYLLKMSILFSFPSAESSVTTAFPPRPVFSFCRVAGRQDGRDGPDCGLGSASDTSLDSSRSPQPGLCSSFSKILPTSHRVFCSSARSRRMTGQDGFWVHLMCWHCMCRFVSNPVAQSILIRPNAGLTSDKCV